MGGKCIPKQSDSNKSMCTHKVKIKIMKDGPYIISGMVPLDKQIIGINKEGNPDKWIQGKKYPPQENYSLCRCGHSQNKPFCDGSHTRVNFVASETAKKKPFIKQAEETDGPTLKLLDVPDLCAVARFCIRAGGTWKLTKKSDNPEFRRIAIEETGLCPSGRLVVEDKKTGKSIEPNFKPSISVVEDPQKNVSGPLWVKGGIQIESSDGFVHEKRNRCTLCCCGKSNKKPFCDGTHISIGFKD
jgi:CDGSH-type Zn-finger protein